MLPLKGGENMKKLVIIALIASVAGIFGASQVDYKESADPGTGPRQMR